MFFLLVALYDRNSPYFCIFVFPPIGLAYGKRNLMDFCNFSSMKVLFRLGNPGSYTATHTQNCFVIFRFMAKGHSVQSRLFCFAV